MTNIVTLSKWLTCVYRSLDEFHQNDEILAQLRTLPIIPLTDGQMVKLTDKVVFFPLSDDRKKKQKKATGGSLLAFPKLYLPYICAH